MTKEMRVAMLASGSKGNATLISTDRQSFLVDIGLSCRELCKRLKLVGAAPEELSGVFITHEHIDHVRGLVTFAKNYAVPIYTNSATWKVLFGKYADLRRDRCRILERELSFGDVRVRAFELSHDAIAPQGYSFEQEGGRKCTYITDTGFVTPATREAAQNSDILVLEANHDLELLRNGSYSFELKMRILSTQGHLSNLAAGEFLLELPRLPERVFLAHLSEENNRPQIALETVRETLDGKRSLGGTKLFVAKQDYPVADYPIEKLALFK